MAFDLLPSEPSSAEADWTDVYRRHAADLRRLIARRVPRDAPVDDLLQEAFYQAYRSRHRVDMSRSIWPWLATLGHRVCIAWWRRRQPEGVPWGSEEVAQPAFPGSDEHLRSIVRSENVSSALAGLSPRHRNLLLGHVDDGLSCEDLARYEGSSAKAVKSALNRARTHVRRHVQERDGQRWGVSVGVVAVLRRWLAKLQHRLMPLADGMGAMMSAAVALGVVGVFSVAPVAMRAQGASPQVADATNAAAVHDAQAAASAPSPGRPVEARVASAAAARPLATPTAPAEAPSVDDDDPLSPEVGIRTRTGVTREPEGTWMTFEIERTVPVVGGQATVGTSVRCDAGKVGATECAVLRMLPEDD